MELRHLHYFLAIASTSSFTQAAAALRITQPTLSHQIKQLEGEIGMPLFDRLGRTVRLTEQGRIFKGYAERALEELERGRSAMSELEGAVRGSLAIGVFRSFGNSLLPRVLAEFNREHPGIRLYVRQVSRADMERGLAEGVLDLAVTTHHHAVPENIVAEEIFTEPLVFAIGPQHPLYGRARVSLEALRDQPLVLRELDYPSRRLIDRCFAARGVAPIVAMEVSSTEAILAIVRSSTLGTICATRALDAYPGLHAVRLNEPALQRTGALLWGRDRYRSAAARILGGMIRSAYAAPRNNRKT